MAMHRDEYYNSKTAVILQAVRNSLFVLTGRRRDEARERVMSVEKNKGDGEKNILNYLFLNIF